MKHWIISLLLVGSLSPCALAAVVLDQEHVAPDPTGYILDYPGDYIAQTFRAWNTGQLVSVGVQIGLSGYEGYDALTDDLLVRMVRTDSNGAPVIGDVLASHTISRYDVPETLLFSSQMMDIDLTSWNVEVHTGQRLAIALSSDHTYYNQPYDTLQYVWKTQFRGQHPGGAFYIYSPLLWGPEPKLIRDYFAPPNTRDMGFRVYVDAMPVPEPASAALIAISLLAIGLITVRV